MLGPECWYPRGLPVGGFLGTVVPGGWGYTFGNDAEKSTLRMLLNLLSGEQTCTETEGAAGPSPHCRGLPSPGLCSDQVSLLGRQSLRTQDVRGTLSSPGFHTLEQSGEQFTHQASSQIHLLRRLERELDTKGESLLVETAQTAQPEPASRQPNPSEYRRPEGPASPPRASHLFRRLPCSSTPACLGSRPPRGLGTPSPGRGKRRPSRED